MRRLVLTCLAACLLGGVAVGYSADVQQLLYPSNRTGNNEIFLLNVDGSGAKNLTESKGSNTDPAWSSDGTRLAFARGSAYREINVVNADGSGRTQLTFGQRTATRGM